MIRVKADQNIKYTGFHAPRPLPENWSREAHNGHMSRNTWAAVLWLECDFDQQEMKFWGDRKRDIYNAADKARVLFAELISQYGASAFAQVNTNFERIAQGTTKETLRYANKGGGNLKNFEQYTYTAIPAVWRRLRDFVDTFGFRRGRNHGEKFERVLAVEYDELVSYLISQFLAQPLDVPFASYAMDTDQSPVTHFVSTDGATERERADYVHKIFVEGYRQVKHIKGTGYLYKRGEQYIMLKDKTKGSRHNATPN